MIERPAQLVTHIKIALEVQQATSKVIMEQEF
jgi:hypothetical protein